MVAEIQARALQIGGFQPPYLRSLPLFWRTRANLGRGAAHQARSRCEAQKPSKPLLSPAGVPSLPGPVPRSSCSCRVHHLLPTVRCPLFPSTTLCGKTASLWRWAGADGS